MSQSFRFFGGKGGVGKTTCAAGWAIRAAERGARVLIVSTDPAHSLGDALGVKLGARPRRVKGARLDAVELDADRALTRWFETRKDALRTLLLRGTYFDDEDVDRFLNLSLPGVDELVGLRELLRLAPGYDEIVVDTAPTGHTLRLLETPETLRRIAEVLDDLQAKHRLLARSLGGVVRADAGESLRADAGESLLADAGESLIDELDGAGSELAALLRDPARASFSWVTLPEAMSVAETQDAVAALRRDGLAVAEIIVNRLTPAPDRPCPLCDARRSAESAAVATLRSWLGATTPVRAIPALDQEPRGIPALRTIGQALARKRERERARARERSRSGTTQGGLRLNAPPDLRLLIFGGKGGVGKTTCATAAALALAETGRRVLLLSTDPAHSLADALGHAVGDAEVVIPGAPPTLRARELDASAEYAAKRAIYETAVDELFDGLAGGGGRVGIDASFDRRVMQDLIELAPPGIDEIIAILTIIDALGLDGAAPARHELVVLDTAPTGHALRLLELPARAREWIQALLATLLKYNRVIGAGRLGVELVALSRGLGRLRELLGDARRARFVAVTRAAELPARETARLRRALRRLGVALSAVIVNAVTPAGCRRCSAAAAAEARLLPRSGGCATLVAPAVAPPPRGVAALRAWGRAWQLR